MAAKVGAWLVAAGMSGKLDEAGLHLNVQPRR